MREITILALLFSAQASAWPWTTVDDCVGKYAPKTESNQGVKIVNLACAEKYKKKNGNRDYAECVFDKVPSAKTDTAAAVLAKLCLKENPPKPQSDEDYLAGFDEFMKKQDKDVENFGKYADCVKSMNGDNNPSVKDFCLRESSK